MFLRALPPASARHLIYMKEALSGDSETVKRQQAEKTLSAVRSFILSGAGRLAIQEEKRNE